MTTREERRARLNRVLLVLRAVVVNVGLAFRWYTGTSNGEELSDLRSGFDWLGRLDVLLVLLGRMLSPPEGMRTASSSRSPPPPARSSPPSASS